MVFTVPSGSDVRISQVVAALPGWVVPVGGFAPGLDDVAEEQSAAHPYHDTKQG